MCECKFVQQIHGKHKPAGKLKYAKGKIRTTSCLFFNGSAVSVGSFGDCRIGHI